MCVYGEKSDYRLEIAAMAKRLGSGFAMTTSHAGLKWRVKWPANYRCSSSLGRNIALAALSSLQCAVAREAFLCR